MKIAWFKKTVNAKVGDLVAGYSFTEPALAIRDDLYVTALCCDDGENRIMIISCDLVGLDDWYIAEIRKKCASILKTKEECILVSCTHNHSGPLCTSLSHPELLNREYLDLLTSSIVEGTTSLLDDFQEAVPYFYSVDVDANYNRRYVTADNCASFLPHRRELIKIAKGFADKELGILFFCKEGSSDPIYAIGNYAAHPLAGHAPGFGGKVFSADFPGVFRKYVTQQCGAECMYLSGACGDLVPAGDELGTESTEYVGKLLAKELLGGIVDATRNPARFKLKDARVNAISRKMTFPLRKKYFQKFHEKKEVEMEVQCLCIGDIAFAGLPDEPCCELGQEIKWHSPFRRTFIAYCATALVSYICPANFLVSGGYEGAQHIFAARNTIDFVKNTVDTLFDLREKAFPSEEGFIYPDDAELPLVALPPNR